MATKLEICNLALNLIQQPSITSLEIDEYDEKGKKVCLLVYKQVFESQLVKVDWNFALKRCVLAVESLPVNEWGYNYRAALPSDCLKVVRVNDYWKDRALENTLTEPRYSVEGRYILSNDGTLNLIYISNAFDIKHASPSFIEVLVAAIAIEICRRLTASNTLLQTVAALYSNRMIDAVSANETEAPRKRELSSWLAVRYM